MMVWPNQFLLGVLCLAAIAVLAPWILRRGHSRLLFGLIPAITATACWVSYEIHLHLIARPGDPLIRIDLLLIVPLIMVDWLSAIAAIAMDRLRGRNV